MVVSIDPVLIRQERIRFDVSGLAWGWRAGLVDDRQAIAVAASEVELGNSDEPMMDLACLLADEVWQVPDILGPIADQVAEAVDGHPNDGDSQRKWSYLEMITLHRQRDNMSDPLSEMESVYCDLGHPESIAGLVRWMPLRPGEAGGEQAIMDRWEHFLTEEKKALTPPEYPQ